MRPCEHCNGNGDFEKEIDLEDGSISWENETCGFCDGFGEIEEEEVDDD